MNVFRECLHSWLEIGETDGKVKKERLYDKLNFSITNIEYTVDKIHINNIYNIIL